MYCGMLASLFCSCVSSVQCPAFHINGQNFVRLRHPPAPVKVRVSAEMLLSLLLNASLLNVQMMTHLFCHLKAISTELGQALRLTCASRNFVKFTSFSLKSVCTTIIFLAQTCSIKGAQASAAPSPFLTWQAGAVCTKPSDTNLSCSSSS